MDFFGEPPELMRAQRLFAESKWRGRVLEGGCALGAGAGSGRGGSLPSGRGSPRVASPGRSDGCEPVSGLLGDGGCSVAVSGGLEKIG